TTVALSHLTLNLANLFRQYSIILHTITQRPRTPRIVSGPRHLQYPAHRRDVKDASVRLDERKSHRASLAKKAVAFFSISRSSRSRSFSLCKRCISAFISGTVAESVPLP